jgi:hypothetical protein
MKACCCSSNLPHNNAINPDVGCGQTPRLARGRVSVPRLRRAGFPHRRQLFGYPVGYQFLAIDAAEGHSIWTRRDAESSRSTPGGTPRPETVVSFTMLRGCLAVLRDKIWRSASSMTVVNDLSVPRVCAVYSLALIICRRVSGRISAPVSRRPCLRRCSSHRYLCRLKCRRGRR